jgi:hypothetical protein
MFVCLLVYACRMDEHSTLLSLAAAAAYAERSPATLRRWIRDGKLTKHQGPAPEGGGHPPALIERAELVALLVASEQKPRGETARTIEHSPVRAVDGDEHLPSQDERSPSGVAHLAALEVERLKGALEATKLRGALEAEQARCEALREQLAQARETGAAYRQARDDAQAERDDWRARHDALASELAALREVRAMPWWRRLLPLDKD